MDRDIWLTNRDIVKVFGCTLPQVRRWALVALGIDRIAARSKGVRRVYSIDEAFKIIMIGELCSKYLISLIQAKTHLDNLWPHFEEYNLLPSQILSGTNYDKQEVYVYIYAGPYYEFRYRIDSKLISTDKSKEEYIEKYKVIRFDSSDSSRSNLSPTWIIGLNDFLNTFLIRCSARGGENGGFPGLEGR